MPKTTYTVCWSAAPMEVAASAMWLMVSQYTAAAERSALTVPLVRARAVIVVLASEHSAAPSVDGLHSVLALSQQLAASSTSARVMLVTCGVLNTRAAHGGVWGCARVLRLEHPKLQSQMVDVANDAQGALASSSERPQASAMERRARTASGVIVSWRRSRGNTTRRECISPENFLTAPSFHFFS